MIPKILHQSSKSLTWEERQLTRKAKTLMPDWDYRHWSDAANLSLLKETLPQHVEDYLKLPAPVIRVDVARCLYLYVHGGIYFDTDYRFFQAMRDGLLSHCCILGVEEDDNASVGGGPKLGNAFMGSEPGLPLWPAFVDSIFKRFETNVVHLSGPHALTKFLKANPEYAEKVRVLPQNVLYPEFTKTKLTAKRAPETIGVHLCWGSWRNKPLPQRVKNRARRILSAL
jgi:mannosyltransferase OCH1-like enzyme